MTLQSRPFSVPSSKVFCFFFFLAFCSHFFYILKLTFQNCLLILLLPFCLAYFGDTDAWPSIFGICCMEYLWYEIKKKKKIHIIKNLFLFYEKETFKKHTTVNNQFLLLFQCYTSLCFNALSLKASSLAFVHFLHVFLFLWYSFFLPFFLFFLASVMFFDLFLKGRADWLSIFIGWKCLYSTKET